MLGVGGHRKVRRGKDGADEAEITGTKEGGAEGCSCC